MSGTSIALLAAVCWGFSYAISAKLMEVYPAAFILLVHALASVPIMLLVLWLYPDTAEAVANLRSGKMVGLLTIEVAFVIVANFCILAALARTNPVLAALIETSYPIFIALALWLLFRENVLNFGLIIGGTMVITGVVVMTTWKPH